MIVKEQPPRRMLVLCFSLENSKKTVKFRSMKFFWGAFFFTAILGLGFLSSKPSPPPKWIINYNQNISDKDLDGVDLAVVDPDNFSPQIASSTGTEFIAYISLGEAEEYRPYWDQVAGKGYLIKRNKNWDGSWVVDTRSKQWQTLILEQILPRFIKMGFSGIFLDTIDTAIYLEEVHPQQYAGAKENMVAFVKKIHQTFPELKIYPNNGLEFLKSWKDTISGVFIEDLYSSYDFDEKKFRPTPPDWTQVKETYLDEFKKLSRKPVFNILYGPTLELKWVERDIHLSEQKGYHWYLATLDLQKTGITQVK